MKKQAIKKPIIHSHIILMLKVGFCLRLVSRILTASIFYMENIQTNDNYAIYFKGTHSFLNTLYPSSYL